MPPAIEKAGALCPKCHTPMEAVHFIAGPSDLTLCEGDPPAGLLGTLTESVTGKSVRSADGEYIFTGAKSGCNYPGWHCRTCREITVPYSL